MQLTILGSGTSIVTARRGPSGYLLRINDKNLLLDSGSGSLRKIVESSVSIGEIDYAIYTHFHPDHTVDMISLLFAFMIPGENKPKTLTLIGPTGMREFYQNLSKNFNHLLEPKGYNLVIVELTDSFREFEDFKITSSRVKHTENSVAYRFDTRRGESLVYSGDTDYCKNIVHLAKDVNALLLECSHPKQLKVDGHLNSSLAGRVARESHCRKLILTHFYPICDKYDIFGQCKEEFGGEIIIAEDLMKITI
ncbi:MAG: MBL fold metallo-hydrolase [Candidatus Scalindua sp. AMX11]|nr:MAG: MBL fold metallo-hydrolase [Candidatus Scalindua sp.]NOG85203.1 MBL fold metallo-hydrolase [Planctomycetota bacterium]RZV66149.1 MAG: MBL fold metallo-hydrolase [Candidatus Scalindua sp. SCAELEC01]TDE63542.1 MAG: MBL fold metallo-hydrolase [Candidatus Scalindua sp. AMX11]GJQ60878.1 MAG: arylsulfatase [Candidatus Scalindua sp.]